MFSSPFLWLLNGLKRKIYQGGCFEGGNWNRRKRPLAATCGHLRPLAATRWERPIAATCGHSSGWGIYLWEGFWKGFLLGQTCEVPATTRANHFRPLVCLDNLHMFICCTGTGLLVEEQKLAEIVSADLIIPEIHWHWVVPAYLPLEVFIFGKGSGMVSCLAKRVRY